MNITWLQNYTAPEVILCHHNKFEINQKFGLSLTMD